MYFLRWIAGYPILIILLVTGLYALYNKDNLNDWFKKNDNSEQVVSSEQSSHVAATAPDTSGHEASTSVAESVVAEVSEPPVDMAKPESADEQMPEQSASVADMAPSDMGDVPPMPEMAGIPPMAEMGNMHPMRDIPPIPEMGDMPPMPEMGMPPMAEMGDMPPIPEMDGFPPMPEMREFPPMEPFPEMAMEPAFAPPMDEPVVTAPATDQAMENTVSVDADGEAGADSSAEATGDKPGSWLDIFKGGKKAPDAPVEVAEETPVVTAETEDTQVNTEEVSGAAEEKPGSWLDIFKAKEPESAGVSTESVQSEESVADEVKSQGETEVAQVEEADDKSGSWLDIFKGKKGETSTESSADASGEYQQQHNESLRLAREAFWRLDFEAAEAIYVNMTKAEPENTELLGEYGNVLLQAGKMDQALGVYEQVAELLIAEDRKRELRPLMRFIGDQDPERAQKLAEKIR